MHNNFIRVVDLETTGTEPSDKVCEIGFVDVDIDSKSITQVMGNHLVNPGIPIPPQISAIHHIIDEDVADAITWKKASGLVFGDNPNIVAYAAHNAKFERQFCTDDITSGKPWICTYKAALRLWRNAPSHSNQALRYWKKYQNLDRNFANNTHRAMPDAYVTAFHLCELLKETSIESLIDWANKPARQVTCHIGKWRGSKWSEVDTGFLHWILDKDFDEDVIYTVEEELEERYGGDNAQ